MSDNREFLELLMVRVNDRIYAVEAPSQEAHKGHLVRFEAAGETLLGEVVDKLWCEKDDEKYRCFEMVTPIWPAEEIYIVHWKRNP